MDHNDWVGRQVIYTSGSNREYIAIVTRIPPNPEHGYTDLPTVSLMFKNIDRPGKYIKRERVIPHCIGFSKTLTWRPYPEGKQLWNKDGFFVDDP
jgi:hypothetical protein